MLRRAATRVVLVTTLALGGALGTLTLPAPAWAGEVPAVNRALGTVDASVRSFQSTDQALGRARAQNEELAHRITALKRLRSGGAAGAPGDGRSAALSELLERSIAAEKELSTRATARDRAKVEVERQVSSTVQLIDDQIRTLRPRLKSSDAAERADVARRLKSLLADRELARGALAQIAAAEATRPQAWAQYEVKVEALDGPADLREKADFVEDTRDKLKKKREALERLVADARQAREIARASVNFRTEVGLFDEQSRSGRVNKSDNGSGAAAANKSGGDQTLAETNEAPRGGAEDPELATDGPPVASLVPPPAPSAPADRGSEGNFGSATGPGSGGTATPAPVVPTNLAAPAASPLPRSVDPATVLNLDLRTVGAGKDVASLEALLQDLVKLDQLLGSQATQIRRRAQALEADEARALGK